MARKIIVLSVLIILASTSVVLLWTRSGQGQKGDTSTDGQMIRETILMARRIRIEAEYTFDTSKFDTVYINDNRGGEIPIDSLNTIREFRHDPTIRVNQVGLLDYEKVSIEILKLNYDNYMAELRAKQALGILTDEEQHILDADKYGLPIHKPEGENTSTLTTQACELYITDAIASQNSTSDYPEPQTSTRSSDYAYTSPGRSYTRPETIPCPTATPTLIPIDVPYRGANPTTLSDDELDIEINLININGNIAKANVHKRAVTSEYTLVKVNGHWYIAGSKLISVAP